MMSRRQQLRALGLGAALAVLLAPALRAAEEITLEQAIDYALKQNRGLRLLDLSLKSKRLDVDNARTEFSFSITPEGNAGTSDDSDSVGYGMTVSRKTTWGTEADVSGAWTEQGEADGDTFYRGSAKVEVRQPLLRHLGPLVNREPVTRAESGVTAARREVELKRTDLIVDVVEMYEDLFRLQRQVEFDAQALARSDKMVRLTRARVAQGRATRVELLRVELQKGEAEIRVSRTRERVQALRADFADLLGFPPEKEFVAGPTPLLSVEVPEVGVATGLAFSNRLDYAQVRQDCRDASRGLRIARRSLLPDLQLISRYERFGEGETASAASGLPEETWFVGLTLESDLNQRKERLQLGQAIITEATAKETLEGVEAGLRRQVQQALLSHDRAQGEALFARRNLHLAEHRALLARRLFEIGRGDNFAVTDSEDALRQAQNEMLSAQAEASIAAYRLLQVLGMLVEYPEELKPEAGDG